MVSYYRAFAPKSEAVKYMDYRATLMQMDDRIERKKSKRENPDTSSVQGQVSQRPRPTEFPHNFCGFSANKL